MRSLTPRAWNSITKVVQRESRMALRTWLYRAFREPWQRFTRREKLSPRMQPITKSWCAQNPERYRELAQPPECCPICLEAFTEDKPANSPLLGDRASTCRHWACDDCWLSVMDGPPSSWKCPWCRVGLQKWMGESFADCYCPPPDAVGDDEIRELAAGVLRHVPQLPADLRQLAERILRHVQDT
jgi:hypothetical protein